MRWFRAAVWMLVFTAGLGAPAQNTAYEQEMKHFHSAEAALASGDLQTAAAEFQDMLRANPRSTAALANLGVIAYQQRRDTEATQLFRRALQIDPLLWDAKAFLGLAEARLGHRDEAARLLADSFPHVKTPGLQVDAGITLLHWYEDSHDVKRAMETAVALQQAAPTNTEVLYAVYRTYSSQAAEALHALTVTAPNSARLHQVLADAALTQDDFPTAIAELRKAIAAEPALPGLHYQLGTTILLHAQDSAARSDAKQAFEAELQLAPGDARSKFQLGEIARLNGDHAAARQQYQAAARMDPALPDAPLALGNLLLEEGKSSEALEPLRTASRLDPANETAHYRLSRAYRALGQKEQADAEMAVFQRLHEHSRDTSQHD